MQPGIDIGPDRRTPKRAQDDQERRQMAAAGRLGPIVAALQRAAEGHPDAAPLASHVLQSMGYAPSGFRLSDPV